MSRKVSIKWMLAWMTFFITMMLNSPVTAGAEQSKTVRVGYVWSTNFSEGESDDEPKSGYAYEYLQKLAYYTGWNYEYVYGDWSTILEMLTKGEVDVMAGVSYTEERAQQMLFPDFPMGTEGYYIYVWQNSELAALGSDELKGLRVGCTAGSMQNMTLEQWNKENGLPCSIETFDGNIEMYHTFASHEIDAVVDTDVAILPTDGVVPLTKVGSSDYYLAVAKGRQDILEELNGVLGEIDRVSPYYLQNLYNKYFSETAVGTILSDVEKLWLKDHSAIRVGYLKNYMPFCTMDEDGQAKGVITDIFETLFDKLTMETDPVIEYYAFANQAELCNAVSDGKVDIIFPIMDDIWLSETQGLFQTTDIMEVNVDMVFRGNYEDMQIEKIAVNRDNLIQYQYAVQEFPDAKLISFDTITACIDAVAAGDVDCTLLNGQRTNSLLDKEYYKGMHRVRLPESIHLTMGVKKGESGLLTLINHGLDTLDKDFALSSAYKYQDDIYVYTARDFLWENVYWLVPSALLVMVVIVYLLLRDSRRTKTYLKQEKEMAKSLEKALHAEQSANRTKTAFLFAMSHDIRTPMNAILGFIDLMEKNHDDQAKLQDYLGKIKASGNTLMQIINNVLEITYLESGNETLNESVMDLGDDSLKVEPLFENEIIAKHLTLTCDMDIQHRYIYADAAKIRSITMNLISNAIKYTPDGGSIRMHFQEYPGEKEGYAVYVNTITDTGIGMSKEFQKRIFESFAREHDTTESKVPGMGLGMSIVKKYVDMMGGKIEIESEPGKGSTFKIILEHRIAEEKITEASDKDQPVLNGKRFLLAEDNELNAEIAMAILEDTGAAIELAVDGAQCVDMVQASSAGYYDLILMDIQMPRMNGYEATKKIRAMSDVAKANIPIVAMTANAFEEDRNNAFAAGMNGFVAKPIEIQKLMETLAAVLKN